MLPNQNLANSNAYYKNEGMYGNYHQTNTSHLGLDSFKNYSVAYNLII